MVWHFKKKSVVQVIDTGTHLPPPSIEQEMRFLAEKDRFIKFKVLNQAKKNNNVIYGCQAVNRIVGKWYGRPTDDWDVMSKNPKKNAIEIEQAIDNHTGANMAHVEQVSYDRDGVKGRMYRVALKNYNPVVDYNPIKKGVSTVTINGVRFENLDAAEKKYIKMINEDDTKRVVNANQDLNRISLFRYWKKIY